MITQNETIYSLLPRDRVRLVQLCTSLTGDRDLAEDLAQESLLIGWRDQHKLRNLDKRAQWLNGIARNLCRMWMREQQRERIHMARTDTMGDELWIDPPAAFDLEAELERHELAMLLDHALDKLPPLTRTVLIERYIHNTPQLEVAQRLGLTEGAIESRIYRGKLTLRRVLTKDMHEEATALGLVPAVNDLWSETGIWCGSCGERRMIGCFTRGATRTLALSCSCGANICFADTVGLFEGVQGYRPALNRLVKRQGDFIGQGLAQGAMPCERCNRSVRVHRTVTPEMPAHFRHVAPALPNSYGVWMHCQHCGWMKQFDIEAIAVMKPELQTFARAHKRTRTLPYRLIETAGTPTLVLSFEAVGHSRQLDLLFDARTLLPFSHQHRRHPISVDKLEGKIPGEQ